MIERYILSFPPSSSDKPITYRLIRDYDFMVNILRAEITAGKEGRLLIEIEANEDELEKGLDFLKNEGVSIYQLGNEIEINEEECMHCGICTSVCFSGALSMNRKEWKLKFDSDKCVACGLCTEACPLDLISLHFINELLGQGL